LSKSTYFYNLNKVNLDNKNEEIINEIVDIYITNKSRYGYRRITLELKNRGFVVNHKKVKRIMSSLNLFGIKAKAKYKSYKGDMNGTCKNILIDKKVDKEKHKTIYDRNFDTTAPNQKWGTDVTEFHIAAGKLYLSPIIDFHTREIISFDVSISPNFRQITNMLNKAFERYPKADGIIMHSDWIKKQAEII
jgi:transposase InsO family protein